MRCIGIIGAMEVRSRETESTYGERRDHTQSLHGILCRTLEGKNVVVVRSGIGQGKCGSLHTDPDRRF